MTTPTKIRLQGTNVIASLLPPIEVLEARYKLSNDHEGIVTREFKLIPGKTRRGTREGDPVGTYTNGSLRQQVEVTWMDGEIKRKVRVQKSRIIYRMAYGPFDESLVIDHIDGNPNKCWLPVVDVSKDQIAAGRLDLPLPNRTPTPR